MTNQPEIPLRAKLARSNPQALQDQIAAPRDAAQSAFGSLVSEVPRTSTEVEAEVNRLMNSLSMAERIHLMSGDGPFIKGTRAMSKRYNGVPVIAGAIRRLGIPGLRFTDGPRGVVMYHSTAFPSPMARGASFDPSLERRIGDAIGVEARTQGANLFAGVCINLLRHPAWGRAQETYGEDSFLLGQMGVALIEGTQRHVMACVKHFAVNSMENSRLWLDVHIDEQDLTDLYLPHFQKCVEAGVAGVMTAYNSVNGSPCGQHHQLITEKLKREWGFDGFVISDFTWGIRNAAAAANAGMDVEMPFRWRFRALPRLLRSGKVSAERINDAARRVLTKQVEFGSPGEPHRYLPEVVAGAEHRALARQAAVESMVLLRNEPSQTRSHDQQSSTPEQVTAVPGTEPLLPLDPLRINSLAVIGWLASEQNIGDLGSSQVHPPSVVTLLHGLTAAGSEHGIDVRYHDGVDQTGAAALARDCDAVVVVAGSSYRDEGEWIIRAGGDRSTLRLCQHDEQLIETVAAANQATVVVLMGGSAFVTDTWHGKVPALLMAWYPGMEGGYAVADLIFGVSSPSGRLPCTWPASKNTLPPFQRFARSIEYGPLHGYRFMEASNQTPAFPFGYGLGYHSMTWSAAVLESVVEHADGGFTVQVAVTIRNSATQSGSEVVQAYIAKPLGSSDAALLTLVGFTKAQVNAESTAKLSVTMKLDELPEIICLGANADPSSHLPINIRSE
jgi:beta-glucosidase